MLRWLWIVVIGVVIGALAKLIMPGKDPGGFIITALFGIAGAVAATVVGHAIGWYSPGESAGFIMSVVGAIILLAIYRVVRHHPLTH